MHKLETKIQYKDYEKGEFTDPEFLNFEETCHLIDHFPWQDQTLKSEVSLTGPSVLIVDLEQNYFKLGHYFSNKYIIYTFSKGLLKSFIIKELSDYKSYLKLFFEGKLFPITEGYQSHYLNPFFIENFKEKDFNYELSFKACIRLLLFPELFTFVLIILFSSSFLINGDFYGFLFLFLLSLPFNSVNLYLFSNYFKDSVNKILNVSKGQDEFYIRENGDTFHYLKSEIKNIEILKNFNYKIPWDGYSVYTINFENESSITFTSLLISEEKLLKVFPHIYIIEIDKYIPKISHN